MDDHPEMPPTTDVPVRLARAADTFEPAPESPSIRSWQKRILGWGCAPAMAVGMLGGLAGGARPELAQTIAMTGTGLAIVVAGPIAVYTWRLRRDNRARWEAAHAEAEASGKRVRVVINAEGGHDYVVEERERIEKIEWDAEAGGEAEVSGAAEE